MTNPQNDLTPQAMVPQPLPQVAPVPYALAPMAFATQAPCSTALAPEEQPPVAPKSDEGGLAESALLALQFTAAPLQSLQNRPARKPRNGKIAHLPKLERDMVDRMLSNNLPHARIVLALEECGFQVTERNISNWKTRGGHQEWCAAQAHALQLRTFQDNLTEFLRRHDAAELPEVGLQSAATSLSAIFLRPDLMRELLSDPQKYSKLIELQCRLAREIQALQKNRDDAARSLGPKYSPELLKRQNEPVQPLPLAPRPRNLLDKCTDPGSDPNGA
jgi:hypothetical protein